MSIKFNTRSNTHQIEFISDDVNVTDAMPPVPAKLCVPEWYKSLPTNNTQGWATIKACIPVQDMITSGYIIRNAYEIDICQQDDANEPDTRSVGHRNAKGNPEHVGIHYHHQCPIEIDGCKKQYFKLDNFWTVKTPPGFSCLFIQPFWHRETRYTLFPTIVDTDTYDNPVVLTGVVHAEEVFTISPGDPLIQIIPFRREQWQHTVSEDLRRNTLMNFFLNRDGVKTAKRLYKNLFHQKKKFD